MYSIPGDPRCPVAAFQLYLSKLNPFSNALFQHPILHPSTEIWYNTKPVGVNVLEVIRTRLREEGSKYKYFFQTARLVAIEEGYPAFYRGLIAQLIRQIPNTAIVLSTYELIVYLLGNHSTS
ncbi:UNVERIFIED_CONTAM: hypothetical protein FKN15_001420 [Acipenser sinensis]